jgi:hypothetical protein
MTTMLDKPDATEVPARGGRNPWLLPEMWGAVAVAFMWLAVLFVGIYGGDFVSENPGSQSTTIPSAVFVAFFAALGTASVAKRAFGRAGR